ncbi:sugar ABC transporter substrate-binding protein [Lentzea flaviverrucosa]|uniref:Ribose transport system substrate-binding protein n=1 Tax=Lentzea flaviverrucosa TaxID=200379 RepID=A0A1H9JQI3_9PSEU|nr:sugar ABC transporter substrate-binding protein [Lentzea flaviverrucosa]RDI26597.1 ribose transport system substrate-binding protein [Lentzea flaviverrucosa]SEQ89097.1 ribose transport system substrate-binding protein [Lentzea flaviverrucosa]
MRAAALVLGLVLLSGCGGAAESQALPHVGFVVKRTGGSFAQEMTSGFHEGVGRIGGVSATVTGPPGQDGHKEVELFRDLAMAAKGGIAVATSEPSLMAPSIGEALAQHVAVVGVDMRLTASSGVKLHVGNDNYELGEKLADELMRRMPPDATGTVVLGNTAPGLAGFDDRAEGIRGRFAEKLPGVVVLGPFDTQRDDAANRDAWKRLVAANPNALAFVGTGDCDGVNLAALKTEKSARWLVGGFGVDPRTLQAVRDGAMVASISPEHYLKGAVAGWLLARHAKGGAALPEGWIETPGLTVTTTNLDQVLHRQESEKARREFFQPQIDSFVEDPASWVRPLEQAR